MAHWITQSAAWCLVTLGLAACGMPAANTQTTAAAGAAAAPAQSSAPAATAGAGAAAGTVPAGTAGNWNDTPAAPTGGRIANGAAVLTPCRQDFMIRDANGDGAISLDEWLKSEEGKTFIQSPEAAFKAKDANGDGKLDLAEFGCETPAPGATPNGRG